MKNKLFKIGVSSSLWTFLLIGTSFPSWAGGYQVNLMGVKQIGMGHVGAGMALDASSVYFNPGALPFLKDKFTVTGGLAAISSQVGYSSTTSNYSTYANNPVVTPFNLYVAAKLNEKFSLGLGVYTPYGSTVKWDENWAGQYLIRDISLRAIYFQPTASYKITEKISLGAGLIYALGFVDLNKATPTSDVNGKPGNAHLNGSTGNFGYNLGLYVKPVEKLSVGLTYHSQINMNISGGTTNFNVPASASATFPANTTFSASLPLPALWALGFGYDVTDKLKLGVDVNYTQWDAYKSLDFEFSQNPGTLNSKEKKNYHNTWAFRVGGQYKVSEKFIVRAGTYYDLSPVDMNHNYSPETPDADKLGLSAGLSFNPTEHFGIDASFLYINGKKTYGYSDKQGFGGNYKYVAYIPALGLNYKF